MKIKNESKLPPNIPKEIRVFLLFKLLRAAEIMPNNKQISSNSLNIIIAVANISTLL